MKLDDALTGVGKSCFGKNSSDVKSFSYLLTEGVPMKRDH